MSEDVKEMSFWDHLEDFRKVLFRSVLFLLVILCVVFANKRILFDEIIFAPADDGFVLYSFFDRVLSFFGMPGTGNFSLDLINIELTSQFMTHISVSFYVSLIISMPFLLYQLWLFVSPALYRREKKVARIAFSSASLLFYAGVLAGYFLVFPLTLRFLANYQVSEAVVNQISLHSYISMFTWVIISMGVVFEMPALAALLSRLGLLTGEFLKKNRKYAFTFLMVAAAVITPSGDAFTLFLVGMPMYILYEISILVCK